MVWYTRPPAAAAFEVDEEALPPLLLPVAAVAAAELAELSTDLQDAAVVAAWRVAEPLKAQALAALPLLDCSK